MDSAAMPRGRLVGVGVAALAALAALALGGCHNSPEDGEDQVKVLFSTDFALGLVNGRYDRAGPAPIDDAYAVALALAHEEIDVRGLVVTHGNDHMAPEVEAAERAMAALDADVPVVPGAAVPLTKPPIKWFNDRLIEDWCVNDGVRFMAEELRENGPMTVMGIGPYTDLACLVRNFPDEAAQIERVIALVGSKPGGGLSIGDFPVPDLNFTMDPVALRILLTESEIPFTAMMFEVTSTASLSGKRIARLGERGRAGRYYARASRPNIVFSDGALQPFDAHTVYRLLEPDAYDCPRSGFRIVARQPTPNPRSRNVDAFRPGLPGRGVEACDAFSAPDVRRQFLNAVIEGVP